MEPCGYSELQDKEPFVFRPFPWGPWRGGSAQGGQWLPSPSLSDSAGIASVGHARSVRTSKPMESLPGVCGLCWAVGMTELCSGVSCPRLALFTSSKSVKG